MITQMAKRTPDRIADAPFKAIRLTPSELAITRRLIAPGPSVACAARTNWPFSAALHPFRRRSLGLSLVLTPAIALSLTPIVKAAGHAPNMERPRPMPTSAIDDNWTRSLGGGLMLRATSQPDSRLLEQFMRGYDRAFVLPDEREDLNGFRACLAINPASRHRFGRVHSEMVMVVEDAATGLLLGGANFLATQIGLAPPNHPPVAVALNYLFVEPAARGRGLSRTLTGAVSELANASVDCPDAAAPALFIEQNDPLRLTQQDYAIDSAHAGIDQVDRLEIWARLGAQLVDFPYAQPALSACQESDDKLAYAVLDLAVDAIDPRWFAAHLQSFFGISVLKGADPYADAVAGPQLASLAAMARDGCTVPILPLRPTIDALRALPAPPNGGSLRAFARAIEGPPG